MIYEAKTVYASRRWCENVLRVRVERPITQAALERAVAITLGQRAKTRNHAVGVDSIEWATGYVLDEIGFHFEDYGTELSPHWFNEQEHGAEAKEIAARFASLVGFSVSMPHEIEHFVLRGLLERHLEDALGLRVASPLDWTSDAWERAAIPKGPDDVADLYRRLDLEEKRSREEFDRVISGRVHVRGPWGVNGGVRARVIEETAERILERVFPEQAQCTGKGHYHMLRGEGSMDANRFNGNVCEIHAEEYKDRIGASYYHDMEQPRRCVFSRDLKRPQ